MKTYRAPWSRALILTTVLTSVFCAALSLVLPLLPQHHPPSFVVEGVRWLPAALVPFCALFMIRGYAVDETSVRVLRVFWSNRIARADLVAARCEPRAMSRSVRICGNGGFFSFSGYFRNEALGSYRAYVTDLERTVVLRSAKKTYVLSPDEPEQFVNALGLPPQ